MVLADDGQAGLFDLGYGVADEGVWERVEDRLALGGGDGGEELGDVEEGCGGAVGEGGAGAGGAGVVLGAAA